MRHRHPSDTNETKDRIQYLVRKIVMLRDGGCILRKVRCNNSIPMKGVVFQADHLVTRANTATYSDVRLIVCVCKGCHAWKHWNKEQYDDQVRTILPKDRVELWDKAMKDSWRPKRNFTADWKLEEVGLKQMLKNMREGSALL